MNTCKNPDKIYLSDFQLKTISIRPSLDPNIKDVEYIRKDALLEWAKETYLSENASAIRKVCFKQLVEKLMSM